MNSNQIKQSYPLTSMQQRMLFHSLYAPDSGVEIEQMVITFDEMLNVQAFRLAWQQVMASHELFRTSFRWEGLDSPLQVVLSEVSLPFMVQDWRALSAMPQENHFDAFLEADRKRGFNFSEAPLMRVTLFRMGVAAYKCVWTFHHILIDGRSLPIVLSELFTFYDVFCEGKATYLEPTRPFREHLKWLQSLDFTQAESFWRDFLKNFIAPTPLMVDQKGITVTHSHGRQERKLSMTLTSALRSLAEAHQLTLHTMLQGAWALLLSRYSGERTVVFGNIRAGRWNSVEGSNSMVGLFINTLPMRVDVEPDLSLLSYLKAVRAQHLALREPVREQSPLLKIQQWSNVPGEMPLFESILVYERYTINEMLQAATQRKYNFELFEQVSPLCLYVYGGYGSSALTIKIGYDKPRFNDATMKRMLDHLQTLLEGMVGIDPEEQQIGDLPLLSKAECQQLLVEWNPKASYPKPHAIHQLFEAQVERQPDAIALSYPSTRQHSSITLTYRQLNERANQMAHYLQGLGVKSNSLVGLCIEHSIEMVIAILAILKAGGAYVPLSPLNPSERLALILQDTQLDFVITQEAFLDLFEHYHVQFILLNETQQMIALQSKENPMSRLTPDHLAYIIYTSGSTGKAKGVLVNHYVIVRLFESTERWYSFNERDVWSLFHPDGSDFSLWELWGALIYGGRLVVIPYHLSSSPEEFYKVLIREQVTVLNQTASAFRQLIQAEEAISMASPALPPLALRHVIFGGEALQPLPPWFERHSEQKPEPLNMYNLTKSAVHLSYRPITLDDLSQTDEKNLSTHPIPDLQLYILEENRLPMSVDMTNEIYVGEEGFSPHYLNQPTKESLNPEPFSHDENARLYKSDDLRRFIAHKAKPKKRVFPNERFDRPSPLTPLPILGEGEDLVKS